MHWVPRARVIPLINARMALNTARRVVWAMLLLCSDDSFMLWARTVVSMLFANPELCVRSIFNRSACERTCHTIYPLWFEHKCVAPQKHADQHKKNVRIGVGENPILVCRLAIGECVFHYDKNIIVFLCMSCFFAIYIGEECDRCVVSRWVLLRRIVPFARTITLRG